MKKLSEHMTVLIVTHNLAQASRISDNVLFLMKEMSSRRRRRGPSP